MVEIMVIKRSRRWYLKLQNLPRNVNIVGRWVSRDYGTLKLEKFEQATCDLSRNKSLGTVLVLSFIAEVKCLNKNLLFFTLRRKREEKFNALLIKLMLLTLSQAKQVFKVSKFLYDELKYTPLIRLPVKTE